MKLFSAMIGVFIVVALISLLYAVLPVYLIRGINTVRKFNLIATPKV